MGYMANILYQWYHGTIIQFTDAEVMTAFGWFNNSWEAQ